jgi:Xaa-Pro aminopeptidase
MFDLDRFQEAILGENLDGWLFCNFHHRDTLADELLALDPRSVSTRQWFYFIPASGNPVKLVHAIEESILSTLPGDTVCYNSRESLEAQLRRFAPKRVALLSDPYLQILSTIDAATCDLVRSCGIAVSSAAGLIQRIRGILDTEGIESHERAAAELYHIVAKSWDRVRAAFRDGKAVYERDIRDGMLASFEKSGLVTDHPPIVAAGPNSGNPHYDIPENSKGKRLEAGDIVQFDLWAKLTGGIYADISWVGFCGNTAPQQYASEFASLLRSRDLVVPYLEANLSGKEPVTGSAIDRAVRASLLENFPETALRHRTGHGIDTECHGSGVNLDSIEFPDTRRILEGSCFSVEPGVYFSGYGFRTEIDVYIRNGKPNISGGPIQTKLMTFQD